MNKPVMWPSWRPDFYHQCFDHYAGTFAGGQEANNKLDAERVRFMRELREVIADDLSLRAQKYNPDMVLAIANGGNWIGIDIAWRLGAAMITLHKDPVTKELSVHPGDQEKLLTAGRLLIVDDIFNRLTNVQKVLALDGVTERAVGALAIADRGNWENRIQLNLPLEAGLTEHIPDILHSSSALWQFAA